RPSTPETIAWGAWYELGTGRRLGPSCFRPPPRRPFRVVANLPFGSTAAFLRRLPTYRQLRRLAHDLGFGLDAWPADLDAVQWAGLYAFLDNGPPGKTR
ncbi:MAG TPA: hypothetical protein VIJ32_05415, partial [Actinomycetes bacterium]